MATVRQAISLQDQMSPVLSKIMKAMSNTIDVMEQMNVASSRGLNASAFTAARKGIADANKALQDFIDDENKLPPANEKVRRGFEGWQAAIVTANQALQLGRTLVDGFLRLTGIGDEMTQMSSRLNLINDGMQTQEELQQMIYESAQRSRGAYGDTADTVAKLNLLAGKVFTNNREAIAFAETMQKAFTISGADPSEQSAALRQMSQALASGALKGDEFNSIVENAPLIAQAIEKYMGVSRAELREMSSEGKITADIIKNAVFSASGEISDQFENMPMTFAAATQSMRNDAMMAFQGVSQKWSQLLNSAGFTNLMSQVSGAIFVVAGLVERTFDFLISNWPTISAVLSGVAIAFGVILSALLIYNTVQAITNGIQMASAIASFIHAAATRSTASATAMATAAQYGWNTALLASPITWIIIAIVALIAVIFAVVVAVAKMQDSTITAFGAILGALSVAAAVVWNIVVGVINAVMQFVWTRFIEPWIGIMEWVLNVFNGGFNSFGDAVKNLLGNIISWFLSLGKVVTKIIDAIFGTNWTDGLNSLQDKVLSWGKNEQAITLSREAPTLQSLTGGKVDRWAYGDAWDWGKTKGNAATEKLGNLFGNVQDLAQSASGAADAAQDIADYDSLKNGKVDASGSTVSLSDEDLQYMRDIAEIDYINKYTTMRPVVNATFGDVRETADVNKVLEVLENAVADAYASSLARG